MTAQDALLRAAKDAKSYLARAIKGDYIGQHEDIRVARTLAAAIEAVEEEHARMTQAIAAQYAGQGSDPRR